MRSPDILSPENHQALAVLKRTLILTRDEFSLTLVRCNYHQLQDTVLQTLQAKLAQAGESAIAWTCITLQSDQTHLLTVLKQQYQQAMGRALMVMNVEQNPNLEALLEGINRDRDEFRKQIPVPVVLWLTDAAFTQLTRFALDFKTWGAASLTFELSMQKSLTLWWDTVEYLFENLLSVTPQVFIPNRDLDLAPGCQRRRELEAAQQQVHFTPVNQATWQFILGRDAYAAGDFEGAIAHFERSLQVWSREQGYWSRQPLLFTVFSEQKIDNPLLEHKALLLLHLGLCWARRATQQQGSKQDHWQQAQDCLAASWEIFTLKQRPAIALQVLLQLGQVLQQRQDWSTLQRLSDYALRLPLVQAEPLAHAQVCGFLAQIALIQQQYEACSQQLRTALELYPTAPDAPLPVQLNLWLLLANCQRQQRQFKPAIATLERVRQELVESWERCPTYGILTQAQLYRTVLQQLRSLYFVQGDYRAAFERKQESHWLRRQPSLQDLNTHHRCAATAQTVPVPSSRSGRTQTVADFLERLSRSDSKLTILHGSSGVGKSQFLEEDLIPTLRRTILAAREVIPILQTRYRDWEPNLCQQFQRQMEQRLIFPVADATDLVSHLQYNGQHQILTVLIWDQFEEFWLTCTDATARSQFYQFLEQVLQLPFVDIILSIREADLHTLLTLEQNVNLERIDHNLLDRQIRYPLKNLSLTEARQALQALCTPGDLPFETALTQQVIQDLADVNQTVRPLELQLLGNQLQAQGITTLAVYQQLGSQPKTTLTVQALEDIVADCGPENQDAAWHVLFALTDDRHNRLIKNPAELWRNIPAPWVRESNQSQALANLPQQLDLILTVLVGSQLVVPLHNEGSDTRYQLRHIYLVPTIRKLYHSRTHQAIAAEFAQSQRQLDQAHRKQRWAWWWGGIMGLLAVGIGLWAGAIDQQRRVAEQAQLLAELRAKSATAQAALVRGDRLTALLGSLRVAHQLQTLSAENSHSFPVSTKPAISSAIQLQILATLNDALGQVWERNRLLSHSETVWDVVYAPDGEFLASVGHDQTVKLWSLQGELLATLEDAADSLTSVVIRQTRPNYDIFASSLNGQVYHWQVTLDPTVSQFQQSWSAHEPGINAIALSPDQTQLATAGRDGAIKLWTIGGKLIRTLSGHTDEVQWLTFSPDGQTLASASQDGTVKLWSHATGQVQQTWQDQATDICFLAFSPDGASLATVAAQTVYLWNHQGQLLKSWPAHTDKIWMVQWSPDGQTLVTGSRDRTLKLWNRTGELQHTLSSHRDAVTTVRFSPDGQSLVSGSADKTLKLWHLGGQPQPQWLAHKKSVTAIDLAPDGQTLVTGSADQTAKRWNLTGKLQQTFTGHQDTLTQVQLSPDGQTLATASLDHRVGLWTLNGQRLRWLKGHTDGVIDVQWHPDGELLASGSRDRTVQLWTAQGQEQQTLTKHTDAITALAWSPDGNWLASAGDEDDSALYLWPYRDGRLGLPKFLPNPHDLIVALEFLRSPHPQNFWLLSASYDNMIQLWTQDGEPNGAIAGLTDSVQQLRLSPDGELLATITWDNRLQLWHRSGELIYEWQSPQDRMTSLDWQADGSAIVTGGRDGTVVVWDLSLESLMAQGCTWLADYFEHHSQVAEADENLCPPQTH